MTNCMPRAFEPIAPRENPSAGPAGAGLCERCVSATAKASRRFLFRVRFSLLFRAGRGQSELDAYIAFVTRIFHELLLVCQSPHHVLRAPRLRPRFRVVDRESIEEVRIIQALPALDQVHLARGAVGSKKAVCTVGEIRRFNYERVAFPMAPRRALVEMHCIGRARAAIQVDQLRISANLLLGPRQLPGFRQSATSFPGFREAGQEMEVRKLSRAGSGLWLGGPPAPLPRD